MMLRNDLCLAMSRLDACADSHEWFTATSAPTFAALWRACPRGDWLLWLAGRLPGLEADVGCAAAACARLIPGMDLDPAEYDCTSAYEIAWLAGTFAGGPAATVEAVRSALDVDVVEEALAAYLRDGRNL